MLPFSRSSKDFTKPSFLFPSVCSATFLPTELVVAVLAFWVSLDRPLAVSSGPVHSAIQALIFAHPRRLLTSVKAVPRGGPLIRSAARLLRLRSALC